MRISANHAAQVISTACALALLCVLGLARTAAAQGEQPEVNALDTVWVLVCAFLVFFMQAGFGFLEAGFVRSKNVVNIMAENFMDTTFATVAFVFVGFGLMIVTMLIDYRRLRELSVLAYGATIMVLLAVLVLGVEVNGARAWFRLGPFQLQPSEFGKIAVIVALAASTAFMTPVSSPVNTLVVTPGRYTFGDFIKLGVPFSLIVLAVSVALVPWLLPP